MGLGGSGDGLVAAVKKMGTKVPYSDSTITERKKAIDTSPIVHAVLTSPSTEQSALVAMFERNDGRALVVGDAPPHDGVDKPRAWAFSFKPNLTTFPFVTTACLELTAPFLVRQRLLE